MMRLDRKRLWLVVAGAALALPLRAAAVDGGSSSGGGGGGAAASSYYEETSGPEATMASASLVDGADAGLPTSLHVVEGTGGVEYRALGGGSWQVRVEMAERPHERVDSVYDLVLALALPVGAKANWRLAAREGTEGASVPLVYGGEKVVLKRNRPLEGAWLPLLVGASAGLPDLSGTGYAWTLWDTILRYDPAAGATLQGFATLDYTADPAVSAPDPGDGRHGAFLVTWIPSLDASVPPFTVRLDTIEP